MNPAPLAIQALRNEQQQGYAQGIGGDHQARVAALMVRLPPVPARAAFVSVLVVRRDKRIQKHHQKRDLAGQSQGNGVHRGTCRALRFARQEFRGVQLLRIFTTVDSLHHLCGFCKISYRHLHTHPAQRHRKRPFRPDVMFGTEKGGDAFVAQSRCDDTGFQGSCMC